MKKGTCANITLALGGLVAPVTTVGIFAFTQINKFLTQTTFELRNIRNITVYLDDLYFENVTMDKLRIAISKLISEEGAFGIATGGAIATSAFAFCTLTCAYLLFIKDSINSCKKEDPKRDRTTSKYARERPKFAYAIPVEVVDDREPSQTSSRTGPPSKAPTRSGSRQSTLSTLFPGRVKQQPKPTDRLLDRRTPSPRHSSINSDD